VVLVAAIIGANLAGVLGILLAAPVVATLRILAEYTYYRLLDMPPFPETKIESRQKELDTPVTEEDEQAAHPAQRIVATKSKQLE
jgi:hypothetical protein